MALKTRDYSKGIGESPAMILTCPSCGTQYFAADETLIGEGQRVRCPACGHQWTLESRTGTAPGAPQAHEVYLSRKRQRARRARGTARVVAWAFGFTVFLAAAAGAVLYRNEIVRYWPRSATAYERVGLQVNRFGLEIGNVSTTRTFDGTTPILTVRGEAVNITRIAQPAARVRIGMRSETGEEIGAVSAALDTAEVPAGQSASFSITIPNPPVEAYSLDVSFTRADGSGEGERAPVEVSAGTVAPEEAAQ